MTRAHIYKTFLNLKSKLTHKLIFTSLYSNTNFSQCRKFLNISNKRLQLVNSSCSTNCRFYFVVAVVFMGSKKYPDENQFDAFLRAHGGSSNAYTDCERVSIGKRMLKFWLGIT